MANTKSELNTDVRSTRKLHRQLYITVVLTPSNPHKSVDEVVEYLTHEGDVRLEAGGEILLATDDPRTLPNAVWVYDGPSNTGLRLVANDGDIEGRELHEDEVDILQATGVCVHFSAVHPGMDECRPPLYALSRDAAKVAVSEYGIPVATGLVTSFKEGSTNSPDQRWLCVRLPAGINMAQ